MNTLGNNTPRLTVKPPTGLVVLPVAGLPGKAGSDGQDGTQGPPGDSVVEDPPVDLTVLFENALS